MRKHLLYKHAPDSENPCSSGLFDKQTRKDAVSVEVVCRKEVTTVTLSMRPIIMMMITMHRVVGISVTGQPIGNQQ